MSAVAYEWHNYGKSTIGNRSDIERVPIERLQAFYRKYYQPDNVMVIVAGNFKEDKALAYLAKYFGALKKPQRRLEEPYTEEPPQDGERSVVLRRVGTVGVVGAVYHIPAGAHEDFAAVEILANLLAAEPSGPLYQGLVKTKKATRVTSVAYGLHDPGLLEILVQVDKDRPLEAVRDTLLELLDPVRTGGVGADEVERAKRKLLTDRELLMSNSNRIGIVLSEWAAKGDWRLFFLHRDRVAKVTPADVNRVARLYLAPVNRTVGLYVPTKQAERASIPATPDVAQLLKDYKGGQAVTQGESFDPTPGNIEKRVRRPALGGGVKAALLPRKTRGGMVSAELTLRYGNEDSLKGNTSATQFLARLMARGTKKHNRQQLRDELDRLRAKVVPSGLLGELTFTIHCKRESFPAVLALVREMLREPTFPAEEFDVLKRQTRDMLEKDRTDPHPLAVRALQGKLSPYPPEDVRHVPTVEESIQRLEAVTLDQVRKLYATQLGGQAGEFVAVGDFDPATTLRLVEDMLQDWKAAVPYRHIDRSARPGVKGETVVINTPDKANAVYFAGLAMPLDDSDPDNPALEVGNFVFGGGPLSSRLANRVRQQEGLSYGVGSQYGADSRDKMARFLMFAICNPANMDKVDRAIREELVKFRKEGVGAAELDEAKKAYLAKLKADRASDDRLMRLLQDGLYAGRTFAYWAELEQKVAALTPAEVTEAFRRHIDPAKLVIIHAGDLKKPAAGNQ
jgi:zinc protease